MLWTGSVCILSGYFVDIAALTVPTRRISLLAITASTAHSSAKSNRLLRTCAELEFGSDETDFIAINNRN